MLGVFITQKLEATQDREEKTLWHRVGTAFKHKAGEGFNIELTPGLAVSGKIVILPITEKNNGSASQSYNLDNLPDNKE